MPIRTYPEEYFQNPNNKNLLYFGLILASIVAIVAITAMVVAKK